MRSLALTALLCVGSLTSVGGLVPGAPDRIAQVFDDQGTLLSETHYRDGRKVGRFRSFWPNGARRVDALFAGDVIEGMYRSWHANGRPAEVRHYTKGHEEGLQQAWTPQGELFLNFEVRDGRHFGLINSKPCVPVEGANPSERVM